MSISYAERRRALPIQVGLRDVTIATCEPFDTEWVPEIEAHTHKPVRLVVASPPELQKYTTEFYTLSRSVRAAIKSGENIGAGQFRAAGRTRPHAPSSSTPTTRAWCRSSTGCGNTPSTSAPATSTSSRAAT